MSSVPAFGSTRVSPATPIQIKVAHGTISSLAFTNPDGKQVTGTYSSDKSTWTVNEDLGYGKTYTASGVAAGADGRTVPIKGSFGTLPTSVEAESTLSPGDGKVVGVAISVVVKFPAKPVDRANIEKHLTITTTPHVDGSWAWIDHDDGWGVDWRPKGYWPANTKVSVAANLYGLEIAPGMYGAQDLTTSFSIGRSQVVYANVPSHNIVVKQDCSTTPGDQASCTKDVATYPASFGKGDIPNNTTRSGIHVVMDKKPTTVMIGTPPATYKVTEYWAVRISDNGEFIHENPGTVPDQGFVNVSNGCVNLSPANAKAYYDSALIGDPVEVTGTNIALSAEDGDMFDYTVPWSEWQNLSALN